MEKGAVLAVVHAVVHVALTALVNALELVLLVAQVAVTQCVRRAA